MALEKWAEAHDAIINVVASIGVVITLMVMAQQSRHSARLARADSLRNSMAHLAQVESVFIDRPRLRAHFYEGEPLPIEPDTRAQVLSIAGALADCMEAAILQAQTFAEGDVDDWRENARIFLANSPALRIVVAEHPRWWPDVSQEFSNLQRGIPDEELRRPKHWWHAPIVTALVAVAKRTTRQRTQGTSR